MSKSISRILSSILIISSISLNLIACGTTSNENDPSTRPSRKPQVSTGEDIQNESIYTDGEIITLADRSKLKYDKNGNHEIIEQGDGKVIIFKTVTAEELDSLTDSQRSLVERQMQSDPNGFALVY